MIWKAAIVVLALLSLVSCAPTATPPTLTEAQKDMAVSQIREYTEVLDAAIAQEGKRLSLALVVSHGITESRAKELGDSFVRLVKTFGPGPAPSKEIGKGTFDFLITVVYPDETIIVQGAKAATSEHITW